MSKYVVINFTHIYNIYHYERNNTRIPNFYNKSFDELIWDICIMGGKPGYATVGEPEEYHDTVSRYVNLYNNILIRVVGKRRFAFFTPVEIVGKTMVYMDLTNAQNGRW